MTNRITIELCEDDRARLDRLAEAMERKSCDKCVKDACEYLSVAIKQTEEKKEAIIENLSEPATIEQTPAESDIDHAELRAKVIELSAKGLKDQVRDIVRTYAQTVTDVPADKVSECYKKLEALEG